MSCNIRKALLYYVIVVATLSLVAWQIIFIRGHFFSQGYPYGTFLFIPATTLSDFTIYNDTFDFWLSTGFFKPTHPFSYFPISAYLFLVFHYVFSVNVVYFYLLCLLLSIGIMSFLLGYKLRYSTDKWLFWYVIMFTVITSYPFMFEIDRANIEGLIWVFLVCGVLFFIKEYFFMAGAMFAVVAAMKLYPIIFILLLLSKNRYKEFVASIFVLVILLVLPAYGLTGSVCETFSMIFSGQSSFIRGGSPSMHVNAIGFDHSLYSMVRHTLFITQVSIEKQNVAIYYSGFIVIFFIWLYFFKICQVPLINQTFALVISALLFPIISADYTLIHLYIPWGLFMVFLAYDAESSGFTTKQALNILIPCAIIFTPQSYLIIEGIGGFGGQVKALVLLYLLIVVLKNPMPSNTLFKENYSKV